MQQPMLACPPSCYASSMHARVPHRWLFPFHANTFVSAWLLYVAFFASLYRCASSKASTTCPIPNDQATSGPFCADDPTTGPAPSANCLAWNGSRSRHQAACMPAGHAALANGLLSRMSFPPRFQLASSSAGSMSTASRP